MDDLSKLCEDRDPPPPEAERQSLLKKYDIPLNSLDFEYVAKCTNGREVEKILHILQSGEEGYYPDLMRATEERLSKLKPNSRYIRRVTPVIDKKYLDKEELDVLQGDLQGFLEEMSKSNEELGRARKGVTSKEVPQVRQTRNISEDNKTQTDNKRIKSTDYASWDKYDPDTEILKMDLEAEKLKKEIDESKKETIKKERKVKFNEFTTQTEASFEANREREKGNEYYRIGEYKQALVHYTNSINFLPSIHNYNNRAMAYIKLKKFENAANDCRWALKYDAKNIKANVRLAQSLEELENYHEALKYATKVIEVDPNNALAQNLINKLNERLKKPENITKTRMKIVEIDDTKTKQETFGSKDKVVPKFAPAKVTNFFQKNKKPQRQQVLLSIPGPSTMPEPYFFAVENKDPEIIKRQEYILNNRPQLLHLSHIESSDDSSDCLEIHLEKSDSKFRYSKSYKENDHREPKQIKNTQAKNINVLKEKGFNCEDSIQNTNNGTTDFSDVIKSEEIKWKQTDNSKTTSKLENATELMHNNNLVNVIGVEQTFRNLILNNDENSKVIPNEEKNENVAQNEAKYLKVNGGVKDLNLSNNFSKISITKCNSADQEIQNKEFREEYKVASGEVNNCNANGKLEDNIDFKENLKIDFDENKINEKFHEKHKENTENILNNKSKNIIESENDLKNNNFKIDQENNVENEEIMNNTYVSEGTKDNKLQDIINMKIQNENKQNTKNNNSRPVAGDITGDFENGQQRRHEQNYSQLNDNGGGGEPHIPSSNNIQVPTEEIHMPYSFLKLWKSIERDKTYNKHAEVLRNLDFNRLTEVIGYKLDGSMLADILNTLYLHFTVAHEIDRVYHFLENLSRMPRFNIIVMFLTKKDKDNVECLFQFLEQHGRPLTPNVKRLYI